jgi:hypothetical protein
VYVHIFAQGDFFIEEYDEPLHIFDRYSTVNV